jgi:DNA polymerase III delta prime subunit
MDLAEKYRPRTLSEVIGNRKAIEELRNWAVRWPADKSAALLYGKAGTGKTSAAIALANDMGWQLLELNASDKRTQGIINETAGQASKNASLLYAQKLILLDEIDNLHGTSDRGGAKAVTELVKKTREPVILTANDLYGVSPTLRGHCKQIPFLPIREQSAQQALLDIKHNEKREILRARNAVADITMRLESPEHTSRDATELKAISADLEILAQLAFDLELLCNIQEAQEATADIVRRLESPEHATRDASELNAISADLETLTSLADELGALDEMLSDLDRSLNAIDTSLIGQIAKSAKGDLRSAINDFQAYIGGADFRTSTRDRTQTAFDLMRSVFGDSEATRPLTISYTVDQTPEDLIHWVDENIPRALQAEGLSCAFQILGRADVNLGRTRKRQHYSLWKYAAQLLTFGVNVAARQNPEQSNAAVKFSPPTRWMRLGQTRSKRALRDGIASKIAAANHVSVSQARQEMIPLYKEFAQAEAAPVAAALDLSADELAFLMDAKKEAAAVKKGLQEAQRLVSEQTSKREPILNRESLSNSDAPDLPSEDLNKKIRVRLKPRSGRPSGNSDDDLKNAPDRRQRYLDEY